MLVATTVAEVVADTSIITHGSRDGKTWRALGVFGRWMRWGEVTSSEVGGGRGKRSLGSTGVKSRHQTQPTPQTNLFPLLKPVFHPCQILSSLADEEKGESTTSFYPSPPSLSPKGPSRTHTEYASGYPTFGRVWTEFVHMARRKPDLKSNFSLTLKTFSHQISDTKFASTR